MSSCAGSSGPPCQAFTFSSSPVAYGRLLSPCQCTQSHQILDQVQERESLAPLELVMSASQSVPLLAQAEAWPLSNCSQAYFLSGSYICIRIFRSGRHQQD